jgi:hypothetical protein
MDPNRQLSSDLIKLQIPRMLKLMTMKMRNPRQLGATNVARVISLIVLAIPLGHTVRTRSDIAG